MLLVIFTASTFYFFYLLFSIYVLKSIQIVIPLKKKQILAVVALNADWTCSFF